MRQTLKLFSGLLICFHNRTLKFCLDSKKPIGRVTKASSSSRVCKMVCVRSICVVMFYSYFPVPRNSSSRRDGHFISTNKTQLRQKHGKSDTWATFMPSFAWQSNITATLGLTTTAWLLSGGKGKVHQGRRSTQPTASCKLKLDKKRAQ